MRVMLPVALFVATLTVASCGESFQTEPPHPLTDPRWSLVSDVRGGAWRVDSKTGAMDYCTVGGDSELRCWPAPVRTIP